MDVDREVIQRRSTGTCAHTKDVNGIGPDRCGHDALGVVWPRCGSPASTVSDFQPCSTDDDCVTHANHEE